jgi:hypothetical protein
MKNIWGVILIIVLVGCADKKEGAAKMQSNNKAGKTYCVGRHLIDVPDYFSINPISTGSFRNANNDSPSRTIEVVARRGTLTPQEFSVEVRKRYVALKSADNGTVDVLEAARTLDEQATIFRVKKINEAYVSELYLLRDGNLVTLKLASFRRQYALAEDTLIEFARRIHSQAAKRNSELLNGFCLGPILIAGEFDSESGSVSFNDDKGENFEKRRHDQKLVTPSYAYC